MGLQRLSLPIDRPYWANFAQCDNAIGMVLQEFPEGTVTYALLVRSGFSEQRSFVLALLAAAVTTPLGTLSSFAFASEISPPVLGLLLALSAGNLIYVGATHLPPRAEREPRRYSRVALGAGVLTAFGIILTGANSMRMERWLARWELVGIPVVVLTGSVLHFAFEWSGYWKPLALIAAVNESVWEHLKLAFWPSLLWALLGYATFRPNAWAFFSAKGYALLVAPMLIVLIFYGYTALLGRNFLGFDIAIFVIAIAAGQLASANLVAAGIRSSAKRLLGVGLLFCQVVAYSTLTFYAQPYTLFEDERNGIIGIPPCDNPPAVPFH